MEQEFPSFLMESYVQEKLLICTWKHTGFAFCFSTNTVLVYIRKNFREQMGNSKGLLQELWGLNQPKWFLLSQMLHSVDFCPDLLTFIPFTGDPDYPNPAQSEGPPGPALLPCRVWRSFAVPGAPAWPILGYLCLARKWDLGGWPRPAAGLLLWEVWCLICQDLMTVVWKGFTKSWVWRSWFE